MLNMYRNRLNARTPQATNSRATMTSVLNFDRKTRSFNSFGMKTAVADGHYSLRPQDMTHLACLPDSVIVSFIFSCNMQLPHTPSRILVTRRTFILGVSGYHSGIEYHRSDSGELRNFADMSERFCVIRRWSCHESPFFVRESEYRIWVMGMCVL
jgi:hypothetical protein